MEGQDFELDCRGRKLQLSAGPVIMGVLNVTPDSFSDGGDYLDAAAAVRRGLALVAEGAGVIDIGGESTRPGAQAVAPEEQIARVEPVIRELAGQIDVPISIDTTSSKVAEAAVAAGAGIVNDISALRFDKDMAAFVAQAQVPVAVMHMQGRPGDMQANPTYLDVLKEVKDFLAERMAFAEGAGIARKRLIIDPGIGFGKTLEHNLLLMKHLDQFHSLGVPVLVGASRKRFIGSVLGIENPAERIWGTAATVAWCVQKGVQLVRVHDVKPMADVARVTWACRLGARE